MNKYAFVWPSGEQITFKGDRIEHGQFGARIYVGDELTGVAVGFEAAWKERDQGCNRCGCKYS